MTIWARILRNQNSFKSKKTNRGKNRTRKSRGRDLEAVATVATPADKTRRIIILRKKNNKRISKFSMIKTKAKRNKRRKIRFWTHTQAQLSKMVLTESKRYLNPRRVDKMLVSGVRRHSEYVRMKARTRRLQRRLCRYQSRQRRWAGNRAEKALRSTQRNHPQNNKRRLLKSSRSRPKSLLGCRQVQKIWFLIHQRLVLIRNLRSPRWQNFKKISQLVWSKRRTRTFCRTWIASKD